MHVRLVVTTLARVLLLAAACCLFWSALPTLWGWKSTTVMSDSMAPSVRAGDIVVAMPIADPTDSIGRVLLVDDPDHPGRLRLHRLVGLTDDGSLTTRGDANPAADSTPIDPSDVHGIAVMRAPALGLPFVWAREGRWELILATAAIALGLGVIALGRRAAHRADTDSGVARVAPSALSVLAAIAVVTVVGSGGTAHAAYATQSPNPANTLAAGSTFGCLVETPLDSPYVLYSVNEGAGSATTDASGNGRTGTILAGATREVGNCTGNSPALALGGAVTSGITVPGAAIAPSNTFSVEIWFRTTSTRGGQLIGFGESASGTSAVADRRIWMRTNGVVRFSIRENNAVRTLSTTGTYNDGTWHHAVATLSSSGMRLYIDGVLEDSNTRTTAYHYNPYGSDGHWRIGGDTTTGMAGVSDATLVSSIDNAAVYATTALNASQVAAHYAAGR
ncbi:LamG-like jellyroll fold domain-containing protein [Pseudolysinimonas sp.]|uniref:LamG-like jellyroll fold domain-containing protein n=1 Tax=Pseudolysinimonas sp. TaxID=2680009 RepID=UPI00286A7B2D|nr:LamG-like jellyroll fold domain-containing protein [Pseudolysinimonas sp.]